MPKTVLNVARDEAVNVHQIRAGLWSRAHSYMHRIAPLSYARLPAVYGNRMPGGSLLNVPRARKRRGTYYCVAPAWPAYGCASSARYTRR